MPNVTTSAKGQIVIPKKEREKIGNKPELRVLVEAIPTSISRYVLNKEIGG